MAHSVSNLYSIDDRGWRTYQLDQMTAEEAKVVADTCPKEAILQRIKACTLTAGFALSVLGLGCLALAVAKLGAVFIAPIWGKVALHLTTYAMIGMGMWTLWNGAVERVQNAWEYATHLDQQGKDALLRKGYLESLRHVR